GVAKHRGHQGGARAHRGRPARRIGPFVRGARGGRDQSRRQGSGPPFAGDRGAAGPGWPFALRSTVAVIRQERVAAGHGGRAARDGYARRQARSEERITIDRRELFDPAIDKALAREKLGRQRIIQDKVPVSAFRRIINNSMIYLPIAAVLAAVTVWWMLDSKINEFPTV